MKKILLTVIFVLGVVLISSAQTSSLCYQESANTTNQTGIDGYCGLDYSGNYEFEVDGGTWHNPSNSINGNWSDNSGNIGGSFTSVFLYINYTKPENALNLSLWRIKDSNGEVNLTIPSSCFNFNNDIIALRYEGINFPDADSFAVWSCFNSSWNELRNVEGFGQIYEEAMYWNITEAPTPQQEKTTLKDGHLIFKGGHFVVR